MKNVVLVLLLFISLTTFHFNNKKSPNYGSFREYRRSIITDKNKSLSFKGIVKKVIIDNNYLFTGGTHNIYIIE